LTYSKNIIKYQVVCKYIKYYQGEKMFIRKFYSPEQVASLLGLSKQTLIRYEKNGVIPKSRRNPINRWREYTTEDISKLKVILKREK